ncbi:hypothetical protein V5738_11280 [Salinisphaera sp. SPP-AMP-43]|uniref:hypothetical protein n=1 Tax=Salinisphaera sp. SPP-AMP-43 TaxID=3121288 RepID=UPI003C6DE07A
MTEVRQAHGTPALVRGPVGQPPITRWDYAGFHVYFENQQVIHTVIPSAPEPIAPVHRLDRRP